MTSQRPRQPDPVCLDPLKSTYHESIVANPERFQAENYRKAALLCIDMQYLDAAPGHGVFADATRAGVPLEAQAYYFDRLRTTVLPNVRRLQDTFRQYQLEVIHTRIQALTQDGRDRSPGHKRLELLARPGSKEAEFLEEIAPEGDEIVVNKTASGVFTSTNMAYLLRNLEVDSLFVTGVYTNECVSTTIRDASDLGFFVALVDDACATVTAELHNFTVATLKDRYARVISTDQAIEEMRQRLNISRS